MSGKVVRNLMRAVRVAQFGGPEVLKVENNIPVPKPAAGQVLVKVQAAGINPVETYIRSGTYAIKPPLPYTPGTDAAGIIEEVGSGVQRYKTGDRVYTVRTVSGSYAEYTVADSQLIGSLDNGLSFEQGAGIGIPLYTAYRACITKGRAEAGQTVLIHGASGAVGLACVQICKAKGLTVFGTAGTQEGAELVKSNGATAVYNHREDGYMDKVLESTNGQGPDLVIEMLANVNLQRDLEIVNRKGTVVVIGNRGVVEINPREVMKKESVVTGMSLMVCTADDLAEMHDGIQEGLRAGWLKPHISKCYTLDQAASAHHDIVNSKTSLGKRVFIL